MEHGVQDRPGSRRLQGRGGSLLRLHAVGRAHRRRAAAHGGTVSIPAHAQASLVRAVCDSITTHTIHSPLPFSALVNGVSCARFGRCLNMHLAEGSDLYY